MKQPAQTNLVMVIGAPDGTGSMKFADKVVLVTGASSGIGRATAEAFAKEGSYVAITGRNQANLDEVEKACCEYGAKDVLQLNVDFAELAAVKTLAEKVVAKFKRLDILVNNVGTVAMKSLCDETEENFDHLFTINVKSLLLLTQAAMPYLIETKGCVVNNSSLASMECMPHMLTYGMTKAALDYFTKTVALEYAPKGVRVNSVNPAMIRTNSLYE